MAKSTTTANNLINIIFNATTWNNICENDSTSPATNLYVSLHTSDPGAGGTQATNETAYTNYARVAVLRTSGGWAAASGGATENAALIQFATCGVTGATVTHVGIGVGSSGATELLYSGALSSSLAIANQITPQFAAGDLTVTES